MRFAQTKIQARHKCRWFECVLPRRLICAVLVAHRVGLFRNTVARVALRLKWGWSTIRENCCRGTRHRLPRTPACCSRIYCGIGVVLRSAHRICLLTPTGLPRTPSLFERVGTWAGAYAAFLVESSATKATHLYLLRVVLDLSSQNRNLLKLAALGWTRSRLRGRTW